MIIQIIIGVILAIAIYSIGFVRGARKASEKKHEGIHSTQKTPRHKLGRYVGRNNGDIQNKRYIMKQEKKLEEAKKLYQTANADQRYVLERLFPELQETEDEKNVKDLIDELKCSLRAANCQNEACNGGHEKRIALLEWAIAWVEKQSNKPKWTEEDDKILIDCYNVIHRSDYCKEKRLETVNWIKSLKQRME